MYLNTLRPASGSKKESKRVGRGIGSGSGKTVSYTHLTLPTILLV